MTTPAVFAFAVALLAPVQDADDAVLAADRVRIDRIDARGGDGSFEVGEAEIAALEARVASRLRLPAPWRVELRPARGPSATIEPCGEEASLRARLAGAAGATLQATATLDGGYMRLEWIPFLDETSPSPFVRDLVAASWGYFPICAVPDVLTALDRALRVADEGGLAVVRIALGDASPLGARPSLRCDVSVRDRRGPELFTGGASGFSGSRRRPGIRTGSSLELPP